jgi:hypothetical protein
VIAVNADALRRIVMHYGDVLTGADSDLIVAAADELDVLAAQVERMRSERESLLYAISHVPELQSARRANRYRRAGAPHPRARCHTCGGEWALRDDGTFRSHGTPHCPGSHRPPQDEGETR